jgi:DNA-binding transcriptional MerR regulator
MKSSSEIGTSLDEIRAIADEVRVKLHLATLEARSTWERLQPQLEQLEQAAAAKGRDAAAALGQLVDDVGAAVRKLRDELMTPPRS